VLDTSGLAGRELRSGHTPVVLFDLDSRSSTAARATSPHARVARPGPVGANGSDGCPTGGFEHDEHNLKLPASTIPRSFVGGRYAKHAHTNARCSPTPPSRAAATSPPPDTKGRGSLSDGAQRRHRAARLSLRQPRVPSRRDGSGLLLMEDGGHATRRIQGALRCATASWRRRAGAFFDDMLTTLRFCGSNHRILGVHVQLREKDWRPRSRSQPFAAAVFPIRPSCGYSRSRVSRHDDRCRSIPGVPDSRLPRRRGGRFRLCALQEGSIARSAQGRQVGGEDRLR